MTTQTKTQANISQPVHDERYSKPLAARLALAWSYVAQLGPAGRGLLMLAVLLLLAVPSIAMLFPSKVTPASAVPEVFSAERAMVHLPIIASEPHPQSSPAQRRVRDYLVQELTASGLEVEVQRTSGLENVVARLHGSDPSGAIVILAHSDTVSYSPGAGDNSSAVSALVEIMRALAAGPTPRNDVIALFDDGEEEPDIFAGTYAFVRKHPWMNDVRVAISIDTAVAGPISTNEAGPNNGWLVRAMARAYTGGIWTSFSGGGQYNSTPFREAGVLVLALEDNYPFKEKHTAEDLPGIVRPASVQQMGEQTLALARELGSLDLVNPWGKQETFFPLPYRVFVHYPEAWSLLLVMAGVILLVIAIGLALRRNLATWRGLLAAFGAILATVALSAALVSVAWEKVPGLMGWKTTLWPDWPEVIPPNGWLVVITFELLVLGLCTGVYLLVRRWSARANFSLAGLVPFAIPAVALAILQPRTAYAFIWPVLIGGLSWIAAAVVRRGKSKWAQDLAALLAAAPLVVLLLPFVPGVVMADGMKSLAIEAGIEALVLGVTLPAVDGLLVRRLPQDNR